MKQAILFYQITTIRQIGGYRFSFCNIFSYDDLPVITHFLSKHFVHLFSGSRRCTAEMNIKLDSALGLQMKKSSPHFTHSLVLSSSYSPLCRILTDKRLQWTSIKRRIIHPDRSSVAGSLLSTLSSFYTLWTGSSLGIYHMNNIIITMAWKEMISSFRILSHLSERGEIMMIIIFAKPCITKTLTDLSWIEQSSFSYTSTEKGITSGVDSLVLEEFGGIICIIFSKLTVLV